MTGKQGIRWRGEEGRKEATVTLPHGNDDSTIPTYIDVNVT